MDDPQDDVLQPAAEACYRWLSAPERIRELAPTPGSADGEENSTEYSAEMDIRPPPHIPRNSTIEPPLPAAFSNITLVPEKWGWDADAARRANLTQAEVIFYGKTETDNEQLSETEVYLPAAKLFTDAYFHSGYAYGTVGVFGTRPLYSDSVAYWEVECATLFGTSMQFGVAKRTAVQHCPMSFVNLIGGVEKSRNERKKFTDGDGYGLSHTGRLFHAGQEVEVRSNAQNECRAAAKCLFPLGCGGEPTRVGLLFNGPLRRLDFFIDGEESGLGFEELEIDDEEPFYPMISSTSQRTNFRLLATYSRPLRPMSLAAICARQLVVAVEEVLYDKGSCSSSAAVIEDIGEILALPPSLLEIIRLEQGRLVKRRRRA